MKKHDHFLVFSIIVLVVCATFFMVNGIHSKADEGKAVFLGKSLSCHGCGQKVEKALNNIVGIESFEMDKKHDEVIVFYDPTVMKPEWIMKSLDASGFHDIKLE